MLQRVGVDQLKVPHTHQVGVRANNSTSRVAISACVCQPAPAELPVGQGYLRLGLRADALESPH